MTRWTTHSPRKHLVNLDVRVAHDQEVYFSTADHPRGDQVANERHDHTVFALSSTIVKLHVETRYVEPPAGDIPHFRHPLKGQPQGRANEVAAWDDKQKRLYERSGIRQTQFCTHEVHVSGRLTHTPHPVKPVVPAYWQRHETRFH